MKKLALTIAFTAMLAAVVRADIAPAPGKAPNRVKKPAVVSTHMDIRLDPNAREAKLIIPVSQLKQLRAELEALDGGDPTAAAAVGSDTVRLRTIVAGLLLSLAVVLGGLWAARTKRPVARSGTAALLAAGVVTGAAAVIVYANAGPPPEARSITGKMFSQSMHIYGFGWGKIKLEAGDGDRVKLIVPDPKVE